MLLQLLFLAALLHFGESQNQCVAEIQSLKTDLRTQLRQDVQELVEDKATKRDVQALKQKLTVGHQLIMDALASNVTKLVQELTSDRATDAGNHTVADGSQQCMTKEEVQTMIRSEVEIVVRSEVKDIIQTEVQAIVRAEVQSLVSYVTEMQQNSTALLLHSLKPERSVQSLLPVPVEVLSPGTKQNPVHSCKDIPRGSPSGYYWIQPNCGPARQQYCDMTKTCCSIEGGWMRIANWNMTDPSQQCPPGFGLVNYPRRTCGRHSHGCASTIFPVHGVEYSRVCGRVIGYQFGNSQAFHSYVGGYNRNINGGYADGVSITHGTSPRNHIWTFVAGHGEKTGPSFTLCPCSRSDHRIVTPDFIGRDYFCETGSHSNSTERQFYLDDPLWDGQGCGVESTCCHHPLYFCKQFIVPIRDDIELRLCALGNSAYADTPLELVEIYVQ